MKNVYLALAMVLVLSAPSMARAGTPGEEMDPTIMAFASDPANVKKFEETVKAGGDWKAILPASILSSPTAMEQLSAVVAKAQAQMTSSTQPAAYATPVAVAAAATVDCGKDPANPMCIKRVEGTAYAPVAADGTRMTAMPSQAFQEAIKNDPKFESALKEAVVSGGDYKAVISKYGYDKTLTASDYDFLSQRAGGARAPAGATAATEITKERPKSETTTAATEVVKEKPKASTAAAEAARASAEKAKTAAAENAKAAEAKAKAEAEAREAAAKELAAKKAVAEEAAKKAVAAAKEMSKKAEQAAKELEAKMSAAQLEQAKAMAEAKAKAEASARAAAAEKAKVEAVQKESAKQKALAAAAAAKAKAAERKIAAQK